MTSIYDRLAAQGTASSRVRAKIEQEERRQQEEKRKRERKARTPAKNPGKLQVMGLGEPQDPKRIVTSPKQMSETLDRLYKQDTASSKAHHAPVNTPQKATSPRRVTAPLPRVAALPSAQDKDNLSSPIAIRMKILIRTKEQKKNGEGYGDLNLSNPEVRRQINLFHAGKSSAKSLAYDVMNALFFRDFTPGEHWSVNPATVNEFVPQSNGVALLEGIDASGGTKFEFFDCDKQAEWDWKDIYSVATAKCTIKVSSEQVCVDDYSYYVAG